MITPPTQINPPPPPPPFTLPAALATSIFSLTCPIKSCPCSEFHVVRNFGIDGLKYMTSLSQIRFPLNECSKMLTVVLHLTQPLSGYVTTRAKSLFFI